MYVINDHHCAELYCKANIDHGKDVCGTFVCMRYIMLLLHLCPETLKCRRALTDITD